MVFINLKFGVLKVEVQKVEALVERDQVNKSEGESLLHKAYGGSLPDFFAAFLQDRKLTKDEAERLQKLIEEAKE